ncbi:hypothetical protein PF008_g26096 [Phytophthora fragariae]|uniref:Uncharacterized protein n=1 Tax=Phytophthora fragariae TaxID=53985 RepID=A0A6G0QIN3_9STRA|nr:hypothetical protein PF008_g26096 [Phytophthora fragariae]
MSDPKTVGANLTQAQQDETMADLAFFLDDFGSTRAVRVKLQEQESDIERLQKQVWRLLDHQSDENVQQQAEEDTNTEKIAIKSSYNDTKRVDDIMANVDFFLQTFGSTRAVRNELLTQSQVIAGLNCTINWFQELHKKSGNSPSLVTEPKSNLMDRLVSALKSAQEQGPRAQQIETVRGGEEVNVTSEVSSDDSNKDGAGSEVEETAGGIVSTALLYKNEVKSASLSDILGKESQRKVDAVPGLVYPEREKGRVIDERGGRCLGSATSAPLGVTEIVNSAEVDDYLSALKCVDEVCADTRICNGENMSDVFESSKQINEIQPISKENVPMTNIEKTTVEFCGSGKEAASKFKNTCSHTGCCSRVQLNGLCYRHGGYYICRAEGCNMKAITRYLCRRHGGGTLCHVPDCAKLTVSGGKGFCAAHAREKKLLTKHKCKVEECNMTRVNLGYCHTHRFEGQASQSQAQKLDIPFTPRNEVSCQSGLSETSRGHHVTCQVIGCMRWVKRDGDSSEYCDKHRHVLTSQEPVGVSESSTAASSICTGTEEALTYPECNQGDDS